MKPIKQYVYDWEEKKKGGGCVIMELVLVLLFVVPIGITTFICIKQGIGSATQYECLGTTPFNKQIYEQAYTITQQILNNRENFRIKLSVSSGRLEMTAYTNSNAITFNTIMIIDLCEYVLTIHMEPVRGTSYSRTRYRAATIKTRKLLKRLAGEIVECCDSQNMNNIIVGLCSR